MYISVNQTNGSKPKKFNGTFKKYALIIGKTALAVFLILTVLGVITIGALTMYVVKADKPVSLDINKTKLDYTSIIYATDSKTNKTFELQRLYKDQNRIWVNLNVIPTNLKWAFICTEDQRFYEHKGVDWKRTTGAFINLFIHLNGFSGGGSSITQQLVKNITGNDEKKVTRKIQEILIALDTEKQYSKDQILESYLNTIPLGETCFGVQTASNTYYGKDVSKLDLAECASLACITNATDYYDPLKHPDHTKTREKIILINMLNQGKITRTQYDDAIKENVVYNTKQVAIQKNTKQSYFVDQVITDVTNDLMTQKGYTKAAAQNLIFSQGLKIYATVDTQIQSIMDTVYTNDKYFSKTKSDVQPQSAMIMVDYTGKIVGIEGGRGQKSGNKVLDRATQSKRQPGSAIKPLAVYAPAIDWDKITYSTIFDDTAPTTKGGKPWPSDDDGRYHGEIPVVTAISQSINTIAVRIMQLITPKQSYDFLTKKLGFTSLVAQDQSLALAIGAVTNGVTLREMAGGYEIFGNGGQYIKPYTYTKVTDNSDKVILENKAVSVQVIGDDTAFIMNQLLQSVVTSSGGTGKPAQLSNMIVGGKTGTTSDNKDRWFVGVTPYYVGVTWFGYDKPKEVIVTGYNPALLAWKAVMSAVVNAKIATQPNKEFPASNNVVQANYSLTSGNIVINSDYGTAVGVGWYKKSNIPPLDTNQQVNNDNGIDKPADPKQLDPWGLIPKEWLPKQHGKK
jgi:penicillin-binding protein 1A